MEEEKARTRRVDIIASQKDRSRSPTSSESSLESSSSMESNEET